jgi:hypothetical protein
MRKFLFIFFLFLETVSAQEYWDSTRYQVKYSQGEYEVNTKRMGVEMETEEALAASYEYKRIAPAYYVGHLYEGSYKFSKATDYLGYLAAIESLATADSLMKKQWSKVLKKRISQPMDFLSVYTLHKDANYLYDYLQQCYQNTDQPQKAWNCIRTYQNYQLQDESILDSYNTLAWIVHRNRFYTSSQFSFLKKNVAENEAYAQLLLDSALKKNKIDDKLNEKIFGSNLEYKTLSVYHYRSILYGYNLMIDSAEKYYQYMKDHDAISHNNYGNFKLVQGEFEKAEKEYKIAKTQDAGDKMLQEFIYYQTIIDVYKRQNKNSIAYLDEYIKDYGYLPGYGWWNIAIARSLLYDGQYYEAKKYLDKAASFKEIHLGTTLGQSHYMLSLGVLQLLHKEHEIASIKFKDKNWWYKPNKITNWLRLKIEKYLHQYLLINQLANNPERDQVLYKVFSTESTISFDELWLLIKDFSPKFFIEKFETNINDNNRPKLKKYFQLLTAMLYEKKGDVHQCKTILDELSRLEIDQYDRLFNFRLQETKYQIETVKDKKVELADQMFLAYPQLIPFSKAKTSFYISYTGPEKLGESMLSEFKKANINVEESFNTHTQKFFIQAQVSARDTILSYHLINSQGQMETPPQNIVYHPITMNHLKLALFGIGNLSAKINIADSKTD